jgi:hypothetical protein
MARTLVTERLSKNCLLAFIHGGGSHPLLALVVVTDSTLGSAPKLFRHLI